MGTRLYPNTEDSDVLESLVGVPKGTMTRLEQNWKDEAEAEKNNTDPEFDVGQQYYDIRHNDGDMLTLSDFMIFGWGRLTTPIYKILEIQGLEPSIGDITDLDLVRLILNKMMVWLPVDFDIKQLKGLHWS